MRTKGKGVFMKFIEKLKTIFTEEIEEPEEEVKVEQIKKEVRSVPIESPSVDKHEPVKVEKKVDVDELDIAEEVAEEETKKEEPKAAPVFFTERDFEDLIEPKRRAAKYEKKERLVEEKKVEEKPKPYGGNYNTNTIIQKEKVTFKPTPIISPVYGVLDKNYHKEDIVDRKDANYEVVDGLSVDSIRNKAYGTLEDEIEDVMVSKPKVEEVAQDEIDLFDELEAAASKEIEPKPKKVMKDKNVKEIEEATIDLTQELDNLLLSKGKYSKVKEETPETKEEKLSESDLFNLIDSMYEEGEEE